MTINYLNANRICLANFCKDEILPELCKKDTRLEALYRTTLDKLAKDTAPSDFELYAKVVAKSFSKDVIERKGLLLSSDTRAFLVRLKHAKTDPASEIKEPKLFVIDLGTKKELGRGIHYVAEAVDEIISGQTMVFKSVIPETNKPSFSSSALNGVRHSKRILKSLNPHGETNGIQKKPYATIGLTNPSSDKQVMPRLRLVGTLEPLYDSELFERIAAIGDDKELFKSSELERYHIGKQLLEGLVAIHKKGYTHGDLKLENALIRGEGTSIVVHISDFGSVRSLDLNNPPSDASGISSADYNLESDMVLEHEAFEDQNWKLLHFYQTRRDLFEMGVLLSKCLTANDPFDSRPEEFIDLNKSCLEIVIKRIWQKPLSSKILQLLNLMLHPNPLARPTAEQALKLYMELSPDFHKPKPVKI